jgi:hypothetical protein
MLYVMHKESKICHQAQAKNEAVRKRPLTKEEQAAIVKRCEERLGAYNFIG